MWQNLGMRLLRLLTVFVSLVLLTAGSALLLRAQGGAPPVIPPVLAPTITADAGGQLVFTAADGTVFRGRERPPAWTLAQLAGSPVGTETGLAFDFQKPGFTGTLVFGLIPYHDTKYPQPVWRTTTPIKDGKATVDIKSTIGERYDMVGWEKQGSGVLGYRIISAEGLMIYDGRVRFTGAGPFGVGVTLIDGPYLANVTPRSAVVWFRLNRPAPCSVTAAGRTYPCRDGETHQEVLVDRLAPDTAYTYTVTYGGYSETYGLRTAPRPGARQPFTFSYSSDSRAGTGGGDRNFSGPNAYVMRSLAALATQRRSAFMLFTGDLVGGGVTSPESMHTEMANWRRSVEPQAHWLPIYAGIGNHEAVVREFIDAKTRLVRVDRFPYDTDSMETIFAANVVNPDNGPASEDGAVYDPDPGAINFPSYRENAFWFVHDNAAFVVMNSNYWYSPTMGNFPETGGNPHAYIMDNQLAWVAATLATLQRDPAIDHVFLTVHTPMFPNGGHVGDDMWYRGNNKIRAIVAGKPVAKGIIERRDEILALIQKHPKVVAVLTGDEHNYNRLRLDATVPIYPADWTGPRVTLRRPFYQINNGAAGAPYYAHDTTPPWSAFVRAFSTQHALCLLHIAGPRVRLEVVNPLTLEVLDRHVLR